MSSLSSYSISSGASGLLLGWYRENYLSDLVKSFNSWEYVSFFSMYFKDLKKKPPCLRRDPEFPSSLVPKAFYLRWSKSFLKLIAYSSYIAMSVFTYWERFLCFLVTLKSSMASISYIPFLLTCDIRFLYCAAPYLNCLMLWASSYFLMICGLMKKLF